MGGSSNPAPQVVQVPSQATTTAQPSPEQQEIMNLAMPGIRNFATSTPQRYQPTRYQAGTVAPFDPNQIAGQNMVLGAAAGPMQGLANTSAGANEFLLGDIWNPASNPFLQQAIGAATRPITQSYNQVVRPAIRDNFAEAGQQFGGSRRNIAEGMAADKYMMAIGDTSSKLVQDQYSNNLNAMIKALGLTPQTMQAQTMPGVATSGVGDVQQGQSQAELNAAVEGYNWDQNAAAQQFNYEQLAPFLQSKELMSMLLGLPGGSTYAEGMQGMLMPTQPSMLQRGMGGAMAGGSLGTAIAPGFGTAAGAGIGGLLGFFS